MLIIACILLLSVLLAFGVSVPLSFGAALILIGFFGGHNVSGFMPAGHWKMNTVVLLAIPMFIIAGGIIDKGRIAEPLVDLADHFLRRIRGGLNIAGVVASAFFGAISGSAAATLTCIGSIIMPHLKKRQYPEGISASLLVCASPLGLLVPPSATQIIYAWVTQQSVLKCFLSTVVPAGILVMFLCIANSILLRKFDVRNTVLSSGRADQRIGVKSFRAIPALLMPAIILGGIYGGIMTPTEAAGIAIIYAIPIGFLVYKGLTWQTFLQSLRESSVTIGVVMIMIFMVLIVSRFLVFEDVPGLAKALVFSISQDPIVIMLMVNVALIMIGMLMDDISGLLLSAPLFLPIVQSAGIDPIHFAAILGVNLGMGNITPPTAPLLYLGSRVSSVPVNVMLRPTLLFILLAWIPTLMLTTFFPSVSLWLPSIMLGHGS